MKAETWELLLRARDYVEMVIDELDESNEYDLLDSTPIELGMARDCLNRAIIDAK